MGDVRSHASLRGSPGKPVKFLCDNCKAKYQIADEKVAGKTVRMKCRKCGHQIEVRAAVTETSVSNGPPHPPMTSGAPPAPPRAGLATSLSAARPRAPVGALAGAFKSNVQDAPAGAPSGPPSASLELSVTDEWYVAINGVPVGPVRISELRRKAASGAVTEESLCWQEGLEEWRPIRSIPDLAAIVRDAAQGSRPSLIGAPQPDPAPFAPFAPRAPTAPIAPRQTTPQPSPPRPLAPRPVVGGHNNVVPLRPAASSPIGDAPPFGPMGASATAAAFAPSPEAPPVGAPGAFASPAIDPFATPPEPTPAPLAALTGPYPSPISAAAPPAASYEVQKTRVPLWLWPILVLALGFGGGLAFLAFRPPPPVAPVVIQVPTPKADVPPETAGDDAPPSSSAEPAPTTSTEAKGKAAPVAAKGPATKPTAPESRGLDLGDLIPGGGGPNVGPGSPAGGSGGGLDQGSVERVVAMHRTGVKRTCWERGGSDRSSVNVMVTANVAPNGKVSSTSSNGDDPVVAKCIENQVRTWQFPAPGSSTAVNIPFKFVRQ